jgi:ribosomal protein L34E
MDHRVFVSRNVTAIEVFHKRTNRYFYVLVNTDDLDFIKSNVAKLSIIIARYTNYCMYRHKNPANKTTSLHRLIMKTPSELVVDHINHNGLDNRKCNLRNTTTSVNNYNRARRMRNPMHLLKEQLEAAFLLEIRRKRNESHHNQRPVI